MVAWNMSEYQHFRHLFKAPFSDIIILLTTFFLTVFVDLTTAITVGMVLSVFLFMKKMKDTSELKSLIALDDEFKEGVESYDVDAIDKKVVPNGVEVFEITGPLFFGVADILKNTIADIEIFPKVFILRMRKVPMMDVSGMHSLIDFYYFCKRKETTLCLSGVNAKLSKSLKRYGILDLIGKDKIFSHIDCALKKTVKILEKKE
jgi:SulP family sulfate permease